MPSITVETLIAATPEQCFDLIRDSRVHSGTKMFIGDLDTAEIPNCEPSIGQTIVFVSAFLGLEQRLTVLVTACDRPTRLVDEMTDGIFKSFKHVHEFESRDGGTLMRDTLGWRSPFGILGRIVDKLLLERHLRNLVSKRNARLKALAESTKD